MKMNCNKIRFKIMRLLFWNKIRFIIFYYAAMILIGFNLYPQLHVDDDNWVNV